MTEGGLKGSRSAEGLDKPGKPGKLSSDLLSKFESDPSLSGPQPLTVGHSRLSAQSFTSSSEEIATSQENVKSTGAIVRIKIPDQNEDHLSPSSGDEDMLSDEEAGKDKKKKKRKYRWKWSPFKKMRKLFRRKKSPTRAKSCEELPTERYKPTYMASEQGDDDSLRHRTISEPSLAKTKTKSPLAATEVYERRNTVDNPVQRTKSEPSRQSLGRLLKNEKVQGKSQDSISEEPAMSSDERESQAGSMTTGLDWTMISSDSGTEAAVSFESLPRASSLEGLQAAHDRIKIAPKHRRPPTRAHPNSTSVNIKRNTTKPHRRSKTDPKDLSAETSVETESNEELTNDREIVNATIMEALESIEEQSKEKVLADMKAKASDIPAKVQESSKVSEQSEVGTSTSDQVAPVQEKEDHTQTEAEENKESTEQNLKELDENEMDNKDNVVINKENKDVQPTKPDVQMENKEESKAKETILKELNVKIDASRPMLDMSRRSKSLGRNFGKKESPMKSPMPNRYSLESIEQIIENPEEKNSDVLELRKLAGKEESVKTESVHEEKSNDAQNSGKKMTPVDDSKLHSKVSTPFLLLKSSDADKKPTGAKLKDKPTEQDNTSGQPDWIKLATKKSERLSQLLDSKDVEASLNLDTDSPSSPIITSDNKGNQLKPAVKEKPKLPIKPRGMTSKNSPDAPHFRSKTSNIKVDKKVPFLKSPSEEETNKDKALSQVPSTGKSVSSDKCVVCGRTVYQMEKCNFDSSVLHRQCVKCSVCKRLLTVGNFVITESKVYCKPHGQAISVSL